MYNPLKPQTAVPGYDEDDAPDVDSALQRRFWYLVAVFNLAVLGAALGPLLLYFEGLLYIGGGLTVLGVAGLAYGYATYRRVQRELAAEEEENGGEDGTERQP
ncbi:MAG: hypothetical protein ABEJ80_04925 [Halarchaeum sp.]